MCVTAPIETPEASGSAGASWTTLGQIELSPSHQRVAVVVAVSGAAYVRLVGPLDGPFWAPSVTSGADTLATTLDAGVSVYRLQIKAATGTVRARWRLFAR